MIDKLCIGEVEEIMIEEGDTIKNAPILNVIVQLYNSLANDDLLKVIELLIIIVRFKLSKIFYV